MLFSFPPFSHLLSNLNFTTLIQPLTRTRTLSYLLHTKVHLLPLVRAGKLEVLDIDVAVRTYMAERGGMYGSEDGRQTDDEGQRMCDFCDTVVRIARRAFAADAPHIAVDKCLSILKY